MSTIEIIEYSEIYKDHIKQLNYEWLEKYFRVEPDDVVQLSDPENEIINKGGLIYYALADKQIVGTVALIKIEDSTYELGKMAVTVRYQGQGIGKKLLKYCIEKVKSMDADKLILYSNTKLVSAIELYKKHGFYEVDMDQTHYERANIKMELILKE